VKTRSCLDMAARRKRFTLTGNQTPFCGLQPTIWLLHWQTWTVDVSKNEWMRMFSASKTKHIYKWLFGVPLQPTLTDSFTIRTNVKVKLSMSNSRWGERPSDHSLRLLLLQVKKLRYFCKTWWFRAWWMLHVLPNLIFKNSTLCPQSVFLGFAGLLI
jgi:hypothetical protein